MTAFSTMEGRRRNAFLILVTFGGDPHIAYKIARALQRGFERVTVCVPGPCVSAGTMLALAAHELTMTDYGWLGPLDVQVPRSDEIFESQSGLVSMQALATLQSEAWEMFRDNLFDLKASTVGQVTLKTVMETATALAKGLYEPLFRQVDPLRLAEDERSKRILEEYGERLQLRSGNLRDQALDKLVAKYPSHQFVIDRDEAKGQLVSTVASPSQRNDCSLMHWVNSHTARSTKCGSCATLVGERRKEETVDIKIRNRTRSVREYEIKNLKKTSEHLKRRRAAMRGIHRPRPSQRRGPNGPGSRKAIEAFLKEAFG